MYGFYTVDIQIFRKNISIFPNTNTSSNSARSMILYNVLRLGKKKKNILILNYYAWHGYSVIINSNYIIT